MSSGHWVFPDAECRVETGGLTIDRAGGVIELSAGAVIPPG